MTCGEAVLLSPVTFKCVGVWIPAELPCVYMYSCLHVYQIPTCTRPSEHDCTVWQGVSIIIFAGLDNTFFPLHKSAGHDLKLTAATV